MPDPIPAPVPAPPPTSSVRDYLVFKEVEAGDLAPDTLVWVSLPKESADHPEKAIDAAATREDKEGDYKEGTKYLSGARLTMKTPAKKVTTTWT